MKEKLTRNIGLKVLSVILAAILWLIITNVNDPITSAPFSNVPVKILNEDAILSTDMVYEIVEGATIDFTVAARRSIKEKLELSDFEVTADFAKLSDVNAVTIDIKCPRYGDDVTVTEGRYQVMKINREELLSKNFKVTVVSKGEPAEGFYVGEKTASTIITVSGPKSKIERIKEIVAEVSVAGASEHLTSYEKLKAYDEEGEEVGGKNLSFSQSYVSINVKIYKIKEIELRINVIGAPAYGYVVSSVDYEPKSIEIAGPDELLAGIKELVIDEDISGVKESIPKEVNLQEELGEGLFLVGDDNSAVINITIGKADTKEVTIWPGDIDVRNLSPELHFDFLTTGAFNLKLIGPADELKNITRSSLEPYIDLKGYTPGTYTFEIRADLEGYSQIADSTDVSVYISIDGSND